MTSFSDSRRYLWHMHYQSEQHYPCGWCKPLRWGLWCLGVMIVIPSCITSAPETPASRSPISAFWVFQLEAPKRSQRGKKDLVKRMQPLVFFEMSVVTFWMHRMTHALSHIIYIYIYIYIHIYTYIIYIHIYIYICIHAYILIIYCPKVASSPSSFPINQVTIGHRKSPIHVIVFSPFGFMLSIAIPSSYKVVLPAMSIGLSPPWTVDN